MVKIRYVLPSIRKYGSYKLEGKYKATIDRMNKEMKYLKIQLEQAQRDLKKEVYPKGGCIYIIDHSTTEKKHMYRLGKSDDMTHRKIVHDSHVLNKKKVVILVKSKFPLQLETCLKAMLYKYRYKNRKDFYICELHKIRTAVKNCIKSFENVENSRNPKKKKSKSKTSSKKSNRKQTGGSTRILYPIKQRLSTLEKQRTNLRNQIITLRKDINKN